MTKIPIHTQVWIVIETAANWRRILTEEIYFYQDEECVMMYPADFHPVMLG